LTIQGVPYLRVRPPAGGELYLTRYGRPLAKWLDPENWFEPEWLAAHRQPLRGTSTIYRVTTRPVAGRSLELVVRYNRMGEELPPVVGPMATHHHAEFNSPFEEIATLMDLRAARVGPRRRRIPTKRPMAIYCPPGVLPLWRTGRVEHKVAAKRARQPEAPLDIERQYVVLYGWIRGIDAQDAADRLGGTIESQERFMKEATLGAIDDLAQAGFRVLDMKPAHIIVRLTPGGRVIRRVDGSLAYALVDYELLEPIR
jgi:hypothetical protein